MRTFCLGLIVAFSVIGSVIGAGFITGVEIMRFFSATRLLPSCFLLMLLTFTFFISLMLGGRSYGGQKSLNLRVLGGYSKYFDKGLTFVCFIILCGMCAGIDATLGEFFNVDEKIPLGSTILLPLSYFVCRKGVRGVAVFNLVLVPIMLGVIVFACHGSLCEERGTEQAEIMPIFLYAGLNALLSSPIIIDSGKGKTIGVLVVASIVSSVVISVCVYIIMQKISTGYSANENLPLLSAFNKNGLFYLIFTVITMFGIATTLVSSHYPIVRAIGKSRLNHTKNAILMVVAIIISRFGFSNIINYCYPLIGGLGLVYCTIIFLSAIKRLFAS